MPDGAAPLRRSATARRLGLQTLYVIAGNLFTLIVGLPLQIYVARVLGADGLGVYSLLDAAMATVSGLLGLGVAQTVVRFIPTYLEKHEYRRIRRLLLLSALLLGAVGATACIVVWVGLPGVDDLWP